MELVNYLVILWPVIVLRNSMVTSVRFLYPVSNLVKIKNTFILSLWSTEDKTVIAVCWSFPAPTAPPGKVIVTAASPTILLVSWSSVPEQHRHGDISQYNVYISLANKRNDSYLVPVFGSTQSYVDDLQIYTLYVIRVSGLNDIGEGPKSTAFTARTMASGRLITLVRKWEIHKTSTMNILNFRFQAYLRLSMHL